MSAPLGLDNPAGGLAINQRLKLKARGVITLAQFLEMTKEVEGFEEERPIEIDTDGSIAVQYPDFCPVLERISPRTQFQY